MQGAIVLTIKALKSPRTKESYTEIYPANAIGKVVIDNDAIRIISKYDANNIEWYKFKGTQDTIRAEIEKAFCGGLAFIETMEE